MDYYNTSSSRVHFSVVASDRDLLRQLNPLLLREGMINVAAGNQEAHYIVDGRRNLKRAASTIAHLAHRLDKDNHSLICHRVQQYQLLIDDILNSYRFDQNLKGFIFLRYLLLIAALDGSILSSLTKHAYVKVAEKFNVSSERVGRNLRYLFHSLYEAEHGVDNSSVKTADYDDFSILHPAEYCLGNRAAILLLLERLQDSADNSDLAPIL